MSEPVRSSSFMRSSAATCAPPLVAKMTGCAVAPMEYPDVSTNRLEREYDELPLLEPQIAERQPGLGPVGSWSREKLAQIVPG